MEVDSNGDRHERMGRDERDGFSDHERWSEEAEELQKSDLRGKGNGRPKRTVAVVLSAESPYSADEDDDSFHTAHGSILSHLPTQHDPTTTTLYVLIYSPSLKSLPSAKPSYSAPSALGSSYSAISTPVHTPGSELQSISPRITPTDDPHFDALYTQAHALVSHPTQILPFTTHDGYVSMLRHLAPQIVYVSETMSGRDGETVQGLKGWVGHSVVVLGDEGHGELADTETETEDEGLRREQWWEGSEMVGLG